MATKAKAGAKTRTGKWSKQVMAHSDAMDLKSGVFKLKSARHRAFAEKLL
jgi:hypothetical protein